MRLSIFPELFHPTSLRNELLVELNPKIFVFFHYLQRTTFEKKSAWLSFLLKEKIMILVLLMFTCIPTY